MLPVMQLVIVESPTKAKKLRSYLGKEYSVEASVGHVRDLPKKDMGVDVSNNFEPTYEISADKKKVIAQLKKQAKEAKTIVLATDPDREGEAIAWHVQSVLAAAKGKEKVAAPFVRATFHEITKSAVETAIANPSQLNMSLVDAQQARRVVDRLVGYEASPVLWRKVRRGLSAGRVQSVALRLIVEKERDIQAFKPEEYWEVDVALQLAKAEAKKLFVEGKFPEEIPEGMVIARVVELASKKYDPKQAVDVEPVITWLPLATYKVKNIEKKERRQSSFPPFTTSTLQQAAANKLGMTSKQTMRFAQQLYEEGVITYHRTDSVNLASVAVDAARSFIAKAYGKEYVPEKPRYFANKSKNAQEAHEAIRVTEVARESVIGEGQLTDRHQKLYDLIRCRFIASQMEAAVYDQATILITATGAQQQTATLKTTGSVLRFAGWRRLFPAGDDVILPDVQPQQELYYHDLNAAQKFTQPPARFNDASLVKELEKRGIGRPSTYASIISVIIDRGYVERVEKRFQPTTIGIGVCDFLLTNFPVFMEYDFTAEMEEDLDRIARGEKEWHVVVKAFYEPFHKAVDTALDSAERVKLPVEETGRDCPQCGASDGGKLVIRAGKFGKFVSCNRFPDCKYTERIVEKFGEHKCPQCLQGDIIIRKSRWGKPFYGCSAYPKCTWASWQKPEIGADGKVILVERVEKPAKNAPSKPLKPTKPAKKAKSSGKKSPKKTTAKKTKS